MYAAQRVLQLDFTRCFGEPKRNNDQSNITPLSSGQVDQSQAVLPSNLRRTRQKDIQEKKIQKNQEERKTRRTNDVHDSRTVITHNSNFLESNLGVSFSGLCLSCDVLPLS